MLQLGRGSHVSGLLMRFNMTAGHYAFRGSGPGQYRAFKMLWPIWVVLITGSTGLHNVLSALANLCVTRSCA